MQSSKEQQEEIRKPSSVIGAKKQENNRMGKSRDIFKKIRDSKRTYHVKMGTIKDRNGMDLTEAEDIKKKWQEYTEELYQKKKKKKGQLSYSLCVLHPKTFEIPLNVNIDIKQESLRWMP